MSQVTYFDIYKKDFSDETRKRIVDRIRNCKTEEEANDKLNGIMTEVIARIYNEAKPLILGNVEREDHVRVEVAINEIRTSISKRWGFI